MVYRFTGWPFQSGAHDFSVINYTEKPAATIIYDLSAGLITHVNWRKKLFIESFNGVLGGKKIALERQCFLLSKFFCVNIFGIFSGYSKKK